MYNNQKEILQKNHVALVNELDPNDIFDQLQQDGLFTESDHELINTGKTRKERCFMLLAILPRRGPCAYDSLKKALTHNYSHLEKLLPETSSNNSTINDLRVNVSYKANYRQESENWRNNGICHRCQPYLPATFSNTGLDNVIQKHCCLILENVEANDLIDLFYQENIIDMNDCEWIRSRNTRRDRCIAFLQKLSKRVNCKMLNVFKESLKRKYAFIADRIDIVNEEVTEVHVSSANAKRNDRKSYFILPKVMPGETSNFPVLDERISSPLPECVLTDTTDECNDSFDELDLTEKLDRKLSIKTRFWNSTYSHSNCRVPSTFSADILENNCGHNNACRSHDTLKNRKRNGTSLSSHVITKYIHLSTSHCQLFTQPCDPLNTKEDLVFDHLSTLVNQGSYKEFDACALGIQQRQSSNIGMICTIEYLFACRFLNTADVDSAKAYIKSGFKLAQKTCNPKYFTLEFFTCQTRMLIIKKKHGKLQNALDDAKMIIEADPNSCTGRAAGWLYMNDVKKLMIRMFLLNPKRLNYSSLYEHLYKQAMDSCQKSLDHFKRDKSKDGPFGFGFALCRLVTLLLRCGDKGHYEDSTAPDHEIEIAGKHLQELEDSDIPITTFLKVPVLLAKSDYHYRRKHTQRALEYAGDALRLTENNILEFKEQAQNRVSFLSAQLNLTIT